MAPWGVSHKDLAHGGLSLSGKDYMKSSLIGGPSGEIFLAQGGGPLGRMYPCSVGIVSHKDLAHGGLSLSGKDYMKSSLIGGPSGEIFLAQGGALWGGCILAQWGLPSGEDST